MPRLHTLYLPGDGDVIPFAFILDQVDPMTVGAVASWERFAEQCGARGIQFTSETIDTDPDTADEWTPDEPVDYFATDHQDCNHAPQLVRDLINLVRAGHTAVWEEWAPDNLDPASRKVMTHRREVCPAFNDGVTGCPMHDPILEGPWVVWPYYATEQGVISRVCEHGVTHPTPEEYLSGFDTPHLCDGCPCAPVADFSIVVSDLANTRLPRGTLLLGVKDDEAPGLSPEWAERLSKVNRDASGKLVPDDPTPVTAPPAPERDLATAVRCGSRFQLAAGSIGCNLPNQHDGTHQSGGKTWGSGDNATPGEWYPAPVGSGIRVQPLDADGEPVGEAGVYDLAGPVRVTEIPTEQGEPVEKWDTAEVELTTFDQETGRDRLVDAGWVGVPETCLAGGESSRCTRPYGHEGVHEFGPFTRV